jgi:S1-C subfamily serine protease
MLCKSKSKGTAGAHFRSVAGYCAKREYLITLYHAEVFMSLADTVTRVRSGVFKIGFFNAAQHKIGGGSAFLCNGNLLTNHHVFVSHRSSTLVGLRRENMPKDQYLMIKPQDFAARLVAGSEEQSYDYAVLRIQEIIDSNDHQFALELPAKHRIGDDIALLGFPLEHDNLTCHSGVISSFYTSGIAKIIQLDASVNAGNSGGPLIDPNTGAVIGMVTRKATGLSQLFHQLRGSIKNNIAVAEAAAAGGGISIGGIDPVRALIASQNQMMMTMDEIERQANVGIGYAFSAEHLLEEICMRS